MAPLHKRLQAPQVRMCFPVPAITLQHTDTMEQQVEDAMQDSTATLDLLFNKPTAVSLGESVRFNKEAAEEDEKRSETVAQTPIETTSVKESTEPSAEDWREAVAAARRQGHPYI